MKPQLERLFEHLRWADALVLEALRSTAEPPERGLNLYAHILAAELIWLDRIEGFPDSVAVWPRLDLAECSALAEQARRRYEGFLADLPAAGLPELVHYANSAGQRFATPVEDILLHVALHGSYHRGQVGLVLRHAGFDPVSTDYIGFVRGAPPPKTP